MDNILKEFFRGNLSPGEKELVRGSEMARVTKELSEIEDQLTQGLTPEHQEIFKRLVSKQASLCRLTAEEYYIDGFKTGARFMLEILSDVRENQKPLVE